MHAVRLHAKGGPEQLFYEEVAKPALQPGDALVRIMPISPEACKQAGAGRLLFR
jgi:NADPH:quinone reductase-like Zn-dependent oxidoreductase